MNTLGSSSRGGGVVDATDGGVPLRAPVVTDQGGPHQSEESARRTSRHCEPDENRAGAGDGNESAQGDAHGADDHDCPSVSGAFPSRPRVAQHEQVDRQGDGPQGEGENEVGLVPRQVQCESVSKWSEDGAGESGRQGQRGDRLNAAGPEPSSQGSKGRWLRAQSPQPTTLPELQTLLNRF